MTDVPCPAPDQHFIYVIAASDDGPCKLGISANPERRLRQLQTGHPSPLSLRHREPVEAAFVRALEKVLHKDMRHLRMKGEWFRLTVIEAIRQVQFTIIRYSDDPAVVGWRD